MTFLLLKLKLSALDSYPNGVSIVISSLILELLPNQFRLHVSGNSKGIEYDEGSRN